MLKILPYGRVKINVNGKIPRRKKMKKVKFLSFLLCASIFISGCNNISEANLSEDDFSDCENNIVIGDEVIYGQTFFFDTVITDSARAAGFSDKDLEKMIYFSVCPSTSDAVHTVNDVMGYLNPIEMNREILQTCDAESLIFKEEDASVDLEDENNLFRLGIKYYYVETKDFADSIKDILENYEVIEEFAMPKVEPSDIKEDDSISADNTENARWLWDKFEVCGDVCYTIEGKKIPAYGIKIRRTFGDQTTTNKNGHFSIGKRAKGLYCWLWADYSNSACSLSNVLGVNASTLVKSGWPESLQNISIKADSNYAVTKMAICNELLTRYENEKAIHSGVEIPRAIVWTTQAGKGTASAPCFKLRNEKSAPDIFFSGCNNNSTGFIKVIHHEYTHYLHVVYTDNKNDFWSKVVNSEVGSSVKSKLADYLGKIVNEVPYYDFSNPYVCFTENLAEWYSYEGLMRGPYRKVPASKYSGIYEKVFLFEQLKSKANITTDDIMKVVDYYNVTTFTEFYYALINRYPAKSNEIKNCFSNNKLL